LSIALYDTVYGGRHNSKTRVVEEDLCSGQNRHRFEYDSRK